MEEEVGMAEAYPQKDTRGPGAHKNLSVAYAARRAKGLSNIAIQLNHETYSLSPFSGNTSLKTSWEAL